MEQSEAMQSSTPQSPHEPKVQFHRAWQSVLDRAPAAL